MPIFSRWPLTASCFGGFLVAALAVFPGGTAPAIAAEVCPGGTVRIVIPFPAGGPVDSAARVITEPLQNALSRNIIIENRPGASGSMGTAYVTQQPGDGCTILMAYDTHGVNPALMPNLPFDTIKDLRSVMLVGTIPNVYAVNNARPWKTFAELLAAAKATPDEITYGTGGNGTLAHLATKVVEREFGVRMSHVPFRGGAPVAQAVLGDHIAVAAGSILVLSPLIKDGRIRPLAQTGQTRHPLLPDVPTIGEFGKPGFSAVSWIGVFLPASTPDQVAGAVSTAFQKVVAVPVVKERLGALGIELQAGGPKELDSWLASELSRWKEVIDSNRIKAN